MPKGLCLNTGRTQFKKGFTPWNKGKKTLYNEGERNANWKGERAGYHAIHAWLVRKVGKAKICSFNPNHKSPKFEWANISTAYLRDIDDFVSLCIKCHHQYDQIRRGKTYANLKGSLN